MNKNWFYRLLLSYMPIFFITTSIIILIGFMAVNEMNRKAALKSNEISARQAVTTIDNALRSIDHLLIKDIQYSEDIFQFFDIIHRNNTYLSILEPSEFINNMNINETLIDSIYLFRRADQTVLSLKGVFTVDQFGDKDFIRKTMKQEISTYFWTGSRNFREFVSFQQERPVVTLVRKVPLLTGNEGIIVVNVSIKSIQRLIEDMSHPEFSFIHVFDRDGKLMFKLSEPLKQAGEESFMPSDKELSALQSDYTGWEVRSGIKSGTSFDFIYSFSLFWILLGLMTVIGGLGWFIIATRRNYKPIESIMDILHAFSLQNKKLLMDRSGDDELKFIEASMENLMEQTTKYQKLHEGDLIFKRRHFFQELVEGTRPISLSEWKSWTTELGIESEFTQMASVVVEIDKYAEFNDKYTHKDQYLLKFVISCIVEEIAEQHSRKVWKEWVFNHQLVVLFLFHDERKDYHENDVALMCREVKEWVKQNLDFTVTIGVGPFVHQIPDLPTSYEEALEVLRYKPTLGSSRVLHYWETGMKPKGEAYTYLHVVHALVQSFSSGDKWEDKFEELFHELSARMYTSDEIASQMNYMIYSFSRKFQGLSMEYDELWRDEAMPQLEEVMGKYESLKDIKEQFYLTIQKLSKQLAVLRMDRSQYQLIQNVKQYLEERYKNPDLSLNQISDEFKLHPSYLSRAFKEEMGEKFIDYLVRIRMDHAKKILKETSLSIQEVADQVGYTRSISFIRVFKKLNGCTPGDYRKQTGLEPTH